MTSRLIALALILPLCACAARTVPWQHSSVPKDEWSRDYNSCRRMAERQVGFRETEGPDPFRDYDRNRAKGQIDSYVGLCMRDLGYVPKPK